MARTALLRIDDRLLHGQIGRYWSKEAGADIIVVANDEVHDKKDQQKLMDLVTPIGSKTYFFSVDQTASELPDLEDDKEALILVENPRDALRLIEKGIVIDVINVGNMRNTGSKKEVNDNVYVDDKDIEYFNKLREAGKILDLRSNPSDEPTNPNKIFE
ncbi:PTS sugar transporter subunit IIB [uncultured Anaerococcus sp.]|uniref:PTS system mannose/fructose/N-acetylgalactosamine-transporter subunit IIB n=1 Tax=uncultured Anaerococcus sp. TaxID=293428 RepID=UPI00262DF7A6|nr:PTS sugar transporter subunit IIB [uncultured Anaerococcus sp.]